MFCAVENTYICAYVLLNAYALNICREPRADRAADEAFQLGKRAHTVNYVLYIRARFLCVCVCSGEIDLFGDANCERVAGINYHMLEERCVEWCNIFSTRLKHIL